MERTSGLPHHFVASGEVTGMALQEPPEDNGTCSINGPSLLGPLRLYLLNIPRLHPTTTEDKRQGENRLVKGREELLWYTNVHWYALELFWLTKLCGEEKSRPTGRRRQSG